MEDKKILQIGKHFYDLTQIVKSRDVFAMEEKECLP